MVSLRGFRTCVFRGELDDIVLWEINIGNVYLEAKTTEKICIQAEPGLRELKGHLLIIFKALYGLRLSGKLFGQLLQKYLRELGFEPSFVE